MEVIFTLIRIFIWVFVLSACIAIWLKIGDWIFDRKVKPGKWYPIRWTEFKYRPGGKNGIEWLFPQQVIAQIPFKPTLPIWCIVINPVYCPPGKGGKIKNIYFYENKRRQKATYKCWKENFCDGDIQWLPFKKFLKVIEVVEVEV